MICPYCKKEMEKGFIQSPHELAWLPGEKRHLFAAAQFHEGALVLSKLSLMKGSAVTAYLCRNCQKVLIDFSAGDSDFNAE